MSEQKYYILEKLARYFKLTKMPNSEFLFMEDDYVFDVPNSQNQFTKKELAEIKDGMFYKILNQRSFTAPTAVSEDWIWSEELQAYEWRNPFIELVPVEDGE